MEIKYKLSNGEKLQEFVPENFTDVETAIRQMIDIEGSQLELFTDKIRIYSRSCRFENKGKRFWVTVSINEENTWNMAGTTTKFLLLNPNPIDDDRETMLIAAWGGHTKREQSDMWITRPRFNETVSLDYLLQVFEHVYELQELPSEILLQQARIYVYTNFDDMNLMHHDNMSHSYLYLHRPTEAEVHTVIQQLYGHENRFSYMQLEKYPLRIHISPIEDAGEHPYDYDDEKLDLSDRLSIRLDLPYFGFDLFLQDIYSRYYTRRFYYNAQHNGTGSLHETLPLSEAYKFILEFYKHTRLKNYFRAVTPMRFKEIWQCAYQDEDKYSRFATPSIDEIVHVLTYTLNRLYLRTVPKHIAEQKVPLRWSNKFGHMSQHMLFHLIENHQRVMITSFQRLSEDRIEKAYMVDKSLYPSDELVTVRFSDTKSEQVPLHQTIAIDDAISFVRNSLSDINNFCWNGSWL